MVPTTRVIGNRPLPDSNQRVGCLCTIEFVADNSEAWTQRPDDVEVEEIADIIERVAAGAIS